ncbi:hypothetical protein WJX77_004464 [Trebouxia sp. C0004]
MLLKVGDGTYPTEPSLEPHHICIPPAMVSPADTLDDFIISIVGSSLTEHVSGHHILTPRNDDVDMLNAKATAMMPAPEHTCLSADDTYDPEDIATYPHDFLHTLTPPDLPPHDLRLKVGMPVAKPLADGSRKVASCAGLQQCNKACWKFH